jgi:Tfp pilus assembly pilus retraction ATPase PilT
VQRDLGDDTKSFDTALVHALRHDPDVIVLGEMPSLHNFHRLARRRDRLPGDRHPTCH